MGLEFSEYEQNFAACNYLFIYFSLRHIGHCPSNELEMCWNMATFFPYHIRSKCFVMLYGLSHVCWEIARQWDHRNFEYNVTITLQPYLPPSRHFTHGKVHQEFTFALMDFESKSLHLYSNHFVSSYLDLAKIIDLLWKMDSILL